MMSIRPFALLRAAALPVLLIPALAGIGCGGCGTPVGEGEGEGQGGPTEGEGEGGEGEGEVIEHETCAVFPNASPGADVCTVVEGSGGTIVFGTILLPGKVYDNGAVAIDEDGNITCVGCDCIDATPRTQIICPDAVVSPGLINAHDHAGWMGDAPWVASDEGVDPALRWEQRHDWRKGKRGNPFINTGGSANADAKAYGELRFVLSGATSTNASGGAAGFLRNLDDPDDMDPIGADYVDYETFPLGDSSGTQLESGCAYPDIRSAPTFAPYAPHVSEGIDDVAHNEFVCQSDANAGVDAIQANTAIIHGIGLLPIDVALMAERGASLIWSPRSNVSLYGDTAQVPMFVRMGVNVALGTDWIPSGSMNMLRELRCAMDMNAAWGNVLSDQTLWRIVTANAAHAMGADGKLGILAAGARADIAIYAKNGRVDYRAVLDAGVQDVALVLKDGKVLSGNSAVVTALESGCDDIDV